VQVLSDVLKQQGVKRVLAFPSMQEAFHAALAQASSEDVIVVFGSFYTVSQILRIVWNNSIQDNGLLSNNVN